MSDTIPQCDVCGSFNAFAVDRRDEFREPEDSELHSTQVSISPIPMISVLNPFSETG